MSNDELQKKINDLQDENARLKKQIGEEKDFDGSFHDIHKKIPFIFNQLNDAVFLFQYNGKEPEPFQEVNDKACSMLGYTREELLTMTILDLAGNESKKRIPEIIKKSNEEKRTVFETFHITRDRKEIPVEISSHNFKFEGKTNILAIVRDISKWKKVEASIREHNEFLIEIVNSLKHPFYVIDVKDYKIKLANSVSNIGVGALCYEFTHHLDKPCSFYGESCPLEIVKETRKPVSLEHKHFDKEGHERYFDLHAHPIFDSDGNVKQIIEYTLDISYRRQTEEVLKQSESRSRAILEAIQDLVFWQDKDGVYLDYMADKSQLYSQSDESIIGKCAHDILPLELADLSLQKIKQTLKSGETQIFNYQLEISGIGLRYFEARMVKSNETEVISIIRDISRYKKIEKQLQEGEEHYRNFFENGLVGLFRSRISDGLILEINSKAAEIFGYRLEDIIGKKNSADLWKDPNLRKDLILRLKLDGEVHGFETEMKRSDGSESMTSISVKAYPDRDYMEGAIIDISIQKKALEDADNLAGILRQSTDSIVLTDLDGNIRYVNPMFEKTTGYTFEDVKGKNPCILRSETAPYPDDYYKNLWDTLEKGEVWKGEFENKKKNGEIYIEEASIFPFRNLQNGKVTGYGAVKRDVTQSRKLEEALKISYNSVVVLKDKAEAANRLKSQFLANMSHDIRTPLNAIMGFTDLLSKNEQRKESRLYLIKIKKAGEGLLNLINDILDFSKIEAGQMDVFKQSFILMDLFVNIRDIFEMQFLEKGVKFETRISSSVPKFIYNDNLRIKQVMANLLTNALKFTEEGKVCFSLDYRSEEDLLIFKIKDTGIGVTSENLKRIFNPFIQIEENRGFSEKGAGLGLAICNKLVLLMDGIISVSSTHGEGTEFILKIPANSNKVEDNPVPDFHVEPGESDLNKKLGNKILIVDDNPVNMELILEQLKNAGFNSLLSAANGSEAVKLAIEHSPDLILMDIQMPVMDGNKAIAKLRKKGFMGPVIALSAYAMREDIDKSLSFGADGYITKPIDFSTFFDRIAVLLEKKESQISDADRGHIQYKNKHRKPEEGPYKIKESVSERMRNIFLSDLENKLNTIFEVLKKKELGDGRHQLKIIAHGYLGNADYFGLSDLTNNANELEQAIQNDEPDQTIITLSKALTEMLKEIYKHNK